MKFKIENYKNINNLNLEISESKINFLFGVSGSGKTSLVSAMIGDESEKNISYGKSKKDMVISTDIKYDEDDYIIFNETAQKKLIFEKDNNREIYSILFSNDNVLESIRNDVETLLGNLNTNRHRLLNYVDNVDEMIKFINKRKLSSTGEFSKNSSIEKLKNEMNNPKYKTYASYVHKNGERYITWIEEGKSFDCFNQGKCPYCDRKLSQARINKLNILSNISPENYKIITGSREIFEKIGISIPNFYYKREINKLEKDLYEAIKNKKIILDLYNMIDSYNMDTLDIKKIEKITFSESLFKLFPEMSEIIYDFNNNIRKLKKKLGNIKLKTSKILGNNLKKLNDYLSKFAVPYNFEIDKFDTKSKNASVVLVSKKDNLHIDRIDNLSYGEKNLISLLIFLVSSNNKIIIIDDPASSYDDNRRKIIFELLYEFHNNQTYIVLSHDQVFVKYALLGMNTKKYVEKTGIISCLENVKGNCCVKNITMDDFDSLHNQVLSFINDNKLSYYRKIINLRILAELNKNSNSKDKILYSYLSAILHNTCREDVVSQLESKQTTEEDVINYLYERYEVVIEKMPNNIYYDFDYNQLTNFEKIAYQREKYRIKRGNKRIKSFLEKEFDDIIHLNTRYFVSLNPYEFNVYSNNIYDNI